MVNATVAPARYVSEQLLTMHQVKSCLAVHVTQQVRFLDVVKSLQRLQEIISDQISISCCALHAPHDDNQELKPAFTLSLRLHRSCGAMLQP